MGDDVRRLIITLFGVFAVFALAAPAAAGARHTAARILHHASRHPHPKVLEACGYLRDQNGSGYEASAKPGLPTQQVPNSPVLLEGSGGWQVCYEAADHALYLEADSGECFALQPSTDDLVFHGCNDDGDQTFYEDSDSGGLVFTNANLPGTWSMCGKITPPDLGTYVAMDDACTQGGQGSYHWEFEISPAA